MLPGDELPASGLRPGAGTYRVSGRIYASVLGFAQPRNGFIQIAPLSGRYIPKPGDVVLGTVTDVQGTFWLLDIGAPRWAPLHMTGTPWEIDVGETERFLRIGDAVAVRVENLDATGRIGVTMVGEGLGRLEGGTIVTIPPAKVPRVIGRSGSMIRTIEESTGTRLTVGQNGRIWVGGPPDGIARAQEAIALIGEEGHRAGLTERVERLLRASPAREERRDGPPEPRDEPSAMVPDDGGEEGLRPN